MAEYMYANTSLFTGYLVAKTDESIYVFTIHPRRLRAAASPRHPGDGQIKTEPI